MRVAPAERRRPTARSPKPYHVSAPAPLDPWRRRGDAAIPWQLRGGWAALPGDTVGAGTGGGGGRL
jgi:hypothetical protein